MSRTGDKLLSKVIDNNDPQAFIRFNVRRDQFPTEGERKAFDFIVDYSAKNKNQAPPFDTVVENVEGFIYEPQVGDTYEFLVTELKDTAARKQILDTLQGEVVTKFNDGIGGIELGEAIIESMGTILKKNAIGGKIGSDVKLDTEEFLTEYRSRKSGESFKVWLSRFSTINEAIGGYFSGNMYTVYGRSGRGKSAITLAEAVFMAYNGATVLIWALEMSKYEMTARIYSLLSALVDMFKTQVNGATHSAGFHNKGLLMGELNERYEKSFEDFLKNINDHMKGTIVIRGVDDEDFLERDVKALEQDIVNTKADVVVVDPFYYMTTPANKSNVAGGNFAALSMALRHLAGRTKVVLFCITQAEETKDENDKDTQDRILRAPQRAEIQKTKSVLQDATNTFGIDTLDGEGIIKLGKGRNGGEGTEVSLIYIPAYGIVEEMPTGKSGKGLEIAGDDDDF
jgi:replicative DNA helicase